MLSLQNVNSGYKGTDVIFNISLKVKEGENLCIIGPNGCGKTTLLKAISGLIPHKGSIKIDGIDINEMKRADMARKIGVLSQISTIYFSYSIYETVLLGRYLHMKGRTFKEPSSKDKEYTDKCLKAVGLYSIKDKQINELSGGQLQRVYLARTLAQEPDIILLDEPTNHLDLKHQADLIDFLRDWSKYEGHSVIGVMHDLNLAIKLSDKVLVLDKGRMAAYGNAHEVISSNLLNKVYDMNITEFMVDSLKLWESLDMPYHPEPKRRIS
jgi:iron complex transport system ATP-binding protein